ncbi:MCE family protein [Pseudonocardia sp. NPDC049154]|uniref:MCE family protein n=1 Tax=Pseudonocardia sp. NPDC049154 TaxID=3155501 RepID=UPI0033C6FBCE
MRSARVLRGLRLGAAGAVCALALTACDFTGVGSLPLPLREGAGSSAMQVTIDMAQVSNLVPNAEVKVADVTVGSVVKTDVDDWHAVLTVGLNEGTELPANAIARVAQKSLLGAEYLELAAPTDQPAVGQLRDGDHIGLERTNRYPETEEVLGALSVVLNGSGLQQVKTVTEELNAVLGGREQDVRHLIDNLQTLVGALDEQKGDIVRAVDGLNTLSGTVAADNEALALAIDRVPPALQELNSDREQLIETLRNFASFSERTSDTVDAVRGDLLANLANLRPALEKLNEAGTDVTESLPEILTFPFPATTSFPSIFRGDYGNLFVVLDITPQVLADNMLGGFKLPGTGGPQLLNAPPLGAGQVLPDPLNVFGDNGSGGGVLDPLIGAIPKPAPPNPGPPVTDPTTGAQPGEPAKQPGGLLGPLLGGGTR